MSPPRFLSMIPALLLCACATPDADREAAHAVSLGEPIVLIGADEQRDGHALFRVSDAIRTSDGRLFIANAGTSEVRVFSPEGDLLRTFSRQGTGPGEHRYLTQIWMAADTVIAFDPVTPKLSYWRVEGELIRETRLENARYDFRGRVQDGRFVNAFTDQPTDMDRGTSRIDTASISLVEPGGRPTVEFARVPSRTRFAATLPTGGTIYTPLPLEPAYSMAIGPQSIYVGYGADTVIARYDHAGSPVGALVLPWTREPLTTHTREVWQAAMSDRASPEERPEMQRYLESLPYPSDLPLFDRLLVDDADRIWVREYLQPGQDSVTWSVHDADGRAVMTVRAPATVEILDVGVDHLTGTQPGPDGVEQVGVWRLVH